MSAVLPILAFSEVPQEVFPLADYPAKLDAGGVLHQEIYGPQFELPIDADYYTMTADRAGFPDSAQRCIKCRAEISFDGGLTWGLLLGFSAIGGAVIGPDGKIAATSSFGVPVLKTGNQRLVRTVMIPIQGIRTAVACVVENRNIPAHPPEQPHSAVFDAVSSASGFSIASITWSHTPAGTPTSVGVGVAGFTIGTVTATYGGNSMTLEKANGQVNNLDAQIFRLATNATGAQSVSLSFSTGVGYPVAGAVTVTGGDTTTIFSASGSAAGTSTNAPSVTIASATDELVMCACIGNPSNPVYTENGSPNTQTSRWNGIQGGETGHGSTQPGAASVTMAYSLSASVNWVIAAASFKAAAGGATQQLGLTMTGSGA